MKLLIGSIIVFVLIFLWKDNKRGYFWCLFALFILAWLFVSFRPALKDEYYLQRVSCMNEKYFRIVHHGKCPEYSSWGAEHGKVLDYQKWVIDLYCSICLSRYDIDKLDAISKSNILYNHFSEESQDYILDHLDEYTQTSLEQEELLTTHLLDTTSRHYCYQKGLGYSGTLLPTDLPKKFSYLSTFIK